MTDCPQDPRVCQCPEHCDGLALHAQDPVAYEAALARCRPTTTRPTAVTLGPSAEPTPCTGTMTCACATCDKQRQVLRSGRGQIRQPWVPRASRARRQTIARAEARRAA